MQNRGAKIWRRLLDDRHGSIAVEFAIAVPVLLTAMLGVIEIGRLFWTRHALEFAVEETARAAMIDKTLTSQMLVQKVGQKISWVDSDDLSVVVQFTTESGKGYTTVTATYQFALMLGYLGINPFSLSASAHVPRPP